jgi:hypothetical protein
METIKLISGAELKITLAPFVDSKNLYQVFLEEVKDVKITSDMEIGPGLLKDMICTLMSSKKFELVLNQCMKRATYNSLKIDENTFEPVDARQDYFEVCFYVAKENLLPFTKSLYVKFAPMLDQIKQSLA